MKVKSSYVVAFACVAFTLFVYFCFFFRYRNTITVFQCPSNCEIGDYNGSFVEAKYINQLLFPLAFDKKECISNRHLKTFTSLVLDFRLNPESDIGSWRMDKCVVQYNIYGLVSCVYIIGDGGYYLYEQRSGGYGSSKKLDVNDLLNNVE